jgi:glutathione-regulated potassium-efflux system ancillary protein KefC
MARTAMRELFTAFALLLVLGHRRAHVLGRFVDGLGAFLAGVLLAGSEFRHALESDIEPFKGLLLGLFFISVGMTIDFGLLGSQAGHRACVLLAGFLALKIGALWIVARSLAICRRLALRLPPLAGRRVRVRGLRRRRARRRSSRARWRRCSRSWWRSPWPRRRSCSRCTSASSRAASAPSASPTGRARGPGDHRGLRALRPDRGRLLLASGVRAVVLDHDADQVESVRKFGYKVFYGDATRLDLLEAAGARKARLLVNAIDDVEGEPAPGRPRAREFPGLPIVSRARNVSHYFELKLRGVQVAERETFEAALRAGRAALEALGEDRYRAKDLADAFRRHNVASVDAMLPFYQDEASRMNMARAGREELERQFARDRERFEREHGGGKR